MNNNYIKQLEADNEKLRKMLEKMEYLEECKEAMKKLVEKLWIYPITDSKAKISFMEDVNKGYKSNIEVDGILYKEIKKLSTERDRELQQELIDYNYHLQKQTERV